MKTRVLMIALLCVMPIPHARALSMVCFTIYTYTHTRTHTLKYVLRNFPYTHLTILKSFCTLGVNYGGTGRYKAGDCNLQSSSNTEGCDGTNHNLDFYELISGKIH